MYESQTPLWLDARIRLDTLDNGSGGSAGLTDYLIRLSSWLCLTLSFHYGTLTEKRGALARTSALPCAGTACICAVLILCAMKGL